jgi:hypothetical protein
VASLKSAAHHLIGIALAVVAGVLQAVIASSPTNDDFLHVVLARQILGGDWPVRDFFDLGTWLAYGISAASQLIFGHRLLAEAVVVGVMLAVSTYLVFRLVLELTGSTLAAALSAVLLIVAGPRGYSYPKIIVYAVAATLWWWYVWQPSFGKILAFGAWVAAAFYWRGDHGVYVAIILVLAVVAAHGISRKSLVRVCQAGAVALVAVTPVLVMVAATVGFGSVIQSTGVVMAAQHSDTHSWPRWPIVHFADLIRLGGPEEFAPLVSLRWTADSTLASREALFTRHRVLPVANDGPRVQVARLLDFSPPAIRSLINEPIVEDTSGIDRGQSALLADTWPAWDQQRFSHWWLRFRVLPGVDEQTRASNAAAALFYALPLLVLLTAVWLRRYLPESVTSWRLALFALAGITTALGLMRSPYDVRAVDNVVIPAILFGCCVAALWNAAARTGVVGRWPLRIATVVLALVVIKSVAVAGQFGDRISYLAGDWRSAERARGAWADVQARLTAQPPLKYWEERDAPVQIRLAQYAAECVPRSRRLLVLWAAPEIYYYADQLMASRHLFFDAGYEKLPVEERLALEKIQRFSPPLVFATGSLEAFSREMYPGVVDYVGRTYEPVASIEEEGVRYIILLKRNEFVVRPYGEHHWPCLV